MERREGEVSEKHNIMEIMTEFTFSLPPSVDGIRPEDLIDDRDEHIVIDTQPTADYQAIESDDKQPIPVS